MNRRFATIGLIAILAGLIGCDAKATRKECEVACLNVTSIVYSDIDKILTKDAQSENKERLNQLTKEYAKGMWSALSDQCIEECSNHQTRKMTDCMTKASSMDEVKACK
jgi:hypothetical protein